MKKAIYFGFFAFVFLLGITIAFRVQKLLAFNEAKNQAQDILKEVNDLKNDLNDLIKKTDRPTLNFIDVPKKNKEIPDDSVYNDVISRQEKPFGNEAGRHINVHETAHGIHSDLRNEYQKKLGYECNVFYCLNGKAVILKDPDILIRHITRNIPSNLRSYRYNLYFVHQLKDWDDMPTYVFDEWSAYILGSECAVEDHSRGIDVPKSDAVSGCLDFSIYAIAMAKTVKELDPKYWDENSEFKEFVKYNLTRAEKAFKEGRHTFKSSGQEQLLKSFLEDERSNDLKDFMKNELGDYFLNI
jgi:hypothetical protein